MMQTIPPKNQHDYKEKRRFGPVAGISLVAILFALGLIPKLRSHAALVAESHQQATAAPPVEVVTTHMASDDNLSLSGDVQAISATSVQARASGYVAKLYVDIGSHVKAGQVLADIESPDADQQAAQANADTAKSRATVGQSVANVAKSEAGVAQSQSELVRQKAAIKQAQAAVAGAKAKVAQAQAEASGAKAKLSQSKHAVETQNASLAQAVSQYDLAQVTAKRYGALLKDGFVAQQDYDQAAATLKTTAANVQAAQANIHAAQSDVTASEQGVAAANSVVDAARSDEDAAQANVAAAVANYQSLLTNVSASRATVQASQADVAASQAAVSSSEANARRYAVLSSFKRVVAPFDGVITARNVDIGSLVTPGTNITGSSTTPTSGLFGIARTDTLRIFVNLPQTYYQSIKPGSKAKVFIQELPNTPFEGTVQQSSGALNSGSRTLLTEVRLPNPGGVLLPGMYAQVQLPTGSGNATLRAPADVLKVDAQGVRVAVVDSQMRVHFRNVTLGRDFGAEVEIVSGIGPADRLIANPSDDLKDGGKVNVVAGGPAQ
ncbi:hypothetical protein CCAX7_002700 [Capsulimonas corticalis]|uniref:Uncharacterized protein n=1 Tax=Capsulimonas corticalis TaxID=2219043 RepID=A0A402CRZ3_9BACT|nr:efflux RND transporter periplasmic adaptor subunit [Capsulimonas corticalis]BDI28219.1 hypothetical protein CCAX7_002700 [Capsulimonas corticalis]